MELAPFFTKFYAFFKKYFSEHMEDNKPSGEPPSSQRSSKLTSDHTFFCFSYAVVCPQLSAADLRDGRGVACASARNRAACHLPETVGHPAAAAQGTDRILLPASAPAPHLLHRQDPVYRQSCCRCVTVVIPLWELATSFPNFLIVSNGSYCDAQRPDCIMASITWIPCLTW